MPKTRTMLSSSKIQAADCAAYLLMMHMHKVLTPVVVPAEASNRQIGIADPNQKLPPQPPHPCQRRGALRSCEVFPDVASRDFPNLQLTLNVDGGGRLVLMHQCCTKNMQNAMHCGVEADGSNGTIAFRHTGFTHREPHLRYRSRYSYPFEPWKAVTAEKSNYGSHQATPDVAMKTLRFCCTKAE